MSESFVRLFGRVKQVTDEFGRRPGTSSYFEILFAVGMLYFQEQQVEYAVCTSRLGGRLDATTLVLQPLACIITSISLDHIRISGRYGGKDSRRKKPALSNRGSP